MGCRTVEVAVAVRAVATEVATREASRTVMSTPRQHSSIGVVAVSVEAGFAALHWACREGRTECARLLLDASATADVRSTDEGNPNPNPNPNQPNPRPNDEPNPNPNHNANPNANPNPSRVLRVHAHLVAVVEDEALALAHRAPRPTALAP